VLLYGEDAKDGYTSNLGLYIKEGNQALRVKTSLSRVFSYHL